MKKKNIGKRDAGMSKSHADLTPSDEDWDYIEEFVGRCSGEIEPTKEELIDFKKNPTDPKAIWNEIGASMSEALIHSIPDEAYLSFTEDELNCIYDWAKSLLAAEEYFNKTEKFKEYAYLMFDAKANMIHEHFLYKKTLLDRANFVTELENIYYNEAESIPEKLRVLSLIQLERNALDKNQAEFRKYMAGDSANAKNNLEGLLQRVVRRDTPVNKNNN